MKIGILTQPLRTNYGGLLQNYALQRVLIALGHEPITIDQGNKRVSSAHQLIYDFKLWSYHLLNPKRHARPLYQLKNHEAIIVRKYTEYFINKYINRTPTCHSIKEIADVAQNLHVGGYVVGSDQCWRASYNPHFPAMFLSFIGERTDVKRVAYAASFGTDTWELKNSQSALYKTLIKKFDLVTVRERSGIDICKNIFNTTAYHVLDPTLLLTKDDYLQIIEAEGETESDGDLFTYILDPSVEKLQFIDKIALENKLKPFKVLPQYKEEYCNANNIKEHIEECQYPPVTKWLKGILDSKMTIVDSFHGTVFSILFNKQFWVIGNVNRGNTRFTSLLSLFGLEERLISINDFSDLDINQPIDWNRVNSVLSQKRAESMNLLSNSLK